SILRQEKCSHNPGNKEPRSAWSLARLLEIRSTETLHSRQVFWLSALVAAAFPLPPFLPVKGEGEQEQWHVAGTWPITAAAPRRSCTGFPILPRHMPRAPGEKISSEGRRGWQEESVSSRQY